jgi:hypothetical protein
MIACYWRSIFCLILRMQIFFDTLEAIHQFTFSLDQHALLCGSCKVHGQFVSHGFCYKQHNFAATEPVGKRILCSSRSGRTGCGRTVQLYIASAVPGLRYGATQLFTFITALLANLSITAAYGKAVGKPESRHAWRWFKKLTQQLIVYRHYLHRNSHTDSAIFNTQSRFRQLLLPTLTALFSQAHQTLNHIANFQHVHQVQFM